MQKLNEKENIFYPVGTELSYRGRILRAVELYDCKDCAVRQILNEDVSYTSNCTINCCSCDRPDGLSIGFEIINRTKNYNKNYNKMSEKRNISISLDEAKSWYKEGGFKKELALKAYKEIELKDICYQDIFEHFMLSNSYNETSRKLEVIRKLMIIADYLNPKNWEKLKGEEGYFIAKDTEYNHAVNGCKISSHITVVYPVVYFKEKCHAEQAAKILTKEEVDLLEF